METLNLTASQAEAVASEAALTVVVAGPGSGKTKTLIERIIYLLSHNLATPIQMVIITFTNAAAREIEHRIAEYYGKGRKIEFYYCGTVHGFMLRLLKDHGKLIGFRGRIAMLDENQQERLIRQVMADMKFKGPMKDVRAALAEGPEKFFGGQQSAPSFYTDLENLAFEYYQRLLSAGMLDFDSVLKFGALAVEAMNRAGMKLPIKFLFWDEFQDSGTDDARIFRALDIEKKFVVGDPDQSIYHFRGGSPEFLLSLVKTSADASQKKLVMLAENFRCAEPIAESANRLIKNNPNFHCGTVSMTGSEGKIWTFRTSGESDEMREIAEDIRSQPDVNQCAILVRFNVLADLYAKAMESYGIPVCKKEKVSKPVDWQVARSLINLFANPDNDMLAYWWIEQQRDTKFANKIKLESLGNFTSINRHYLKLPNDIRAADVPAALGQSGIGVESIQLVNKALSELPVGATLSELSFALGDDELHKKEVGQGLTVTTVHAAKGREFSAVWMPALEEGILPSASKSASIEEERRLCFVGFTRAKHRLTVSFSQYRKPLFGGVKPEKTVPSRFIDEIRNSGL